MSGRVLPFPAAAQPYRGTVCVMGDPVNGFEVAHESATGDSWGSFSNHERGQDAITAAYALNRDVYFGGCDISICQAAQQDRDPDSASSYSQDDF